MHARSTASTAARISSASPPFHCTPRHASRSRVSTAPGRLSCSPSPPSTPHSCSLLAIPSSACSCVKPSPSLPALPTALSSHPGRVSCQLPTRLATSKKNVQPSAATSSLIAASTAATCPAAIGQLVSQCARVSFLSLPHTHRSSAFPPGASTRFSCRSSADCGRRSSSRTELRMRHSRPCSIAICTAALAPLNAIAVALACASPLVAMRSASPTLAAVPSPLLAAARAAVRKPTACCVRTRTSPVTGAPPCV